MSYILQALKKAEAERRLGQVPDAHSVLAAAEADRAPGDAGARPARWAGLGAALVLIGGVAVAAWWLAARGPVATAPVAVAPPAPLPAPSPPSPVAAAPAPSPPPVIELAPLPPPAPAASAVAAPPAASAAEPIWIEQLPPAERAALPRLVVAGAIQAANRADRVLLLDGEARREGDTLAPGLVLERIEPGHALLRWREQRLKLRL